MPFDGTKFKQDPVLESLRAAREIVAQPGGWHQGWFSNGEGAYCVRGAILEADIQLGFCAPGIDCNYKRSDDELFAALPAWWRAFRGWPLLFKRNPLQADSWIGWFDKISAIEQYNDRPRRTQQEIVALFDRAIARREAKL